MMCRWWMRDLHRSVQASSRHRRPLFPLLTSWGRGEGGGESCSLTPQIRQTDRHAHPGRASRTSCLCPLVSEGSGGGSCSGRRCPAVCACVCLRAYVSPRQRASEPCSAWARVHRQIRSCRTHAAAAQASCVRPRTFLQSSGHDSRTSTSTCALNDKQRTTRQDAPATGTWRQKTKARSRDHWQRSVMGQSRPMLESSLGGSVASRWPQHASAMRRLDTKIDTPPQASTMPLCSLLR